MHDLWDKLFQIFQIDGNLNTILNKAAELPVEFEVEPCIIMNTHISQHYRDFTLASCHLNHWKNECLFNYLIRLTSNQTPKAHVTGPLWGKSTSDWWIPITKDQLHEKCLVKTVLVTYCKHWSPWFTSFQTWWVVFYYTFNCHAY